MSANGDIEIAVTAEGADDAAAELAEGGEAEGGGMAAAAGGGGGGGLRGNLRAGAIAGALLSVIGPLLDILNPIMKILQAFLAPLSIMLMRLLSPVLRVLIRLLPAWFAFMEWVNDGIAGILSWFEELGANTREFINTLATGLSNLPGQIWTAIKSGASWLTNGAFAIGEAVWTMIASGASWFLNGAVAVGEAVWKKLKTGASWLTNGAVNIGKEAWNYLKQGFDNVEEGLNNTLNDIWESIKDLPGDIGSAVVSALDPGLFAEGGVVTGPTFGVVGEAGPEAIIPLDRLESIITSQQGGGTNVQIGGGLAPFVENVNRDPNVEL